MSFLVFTFASLIILVLDVCVSLYFWYYEFECQFKWKCLKWPAASVDCWGELKHLKVTIRPGIPGTVPIFNDVSREKISRDAHFPRFWVGVRDLSWFANLCCRMITHRWQRLAQVLSVYTKKSLAAGAPPGPHWGSSRRSARPPSRIPDGLCLWWSHPTIRAFDARPGLRCPNYGHFLIFCLIRMHACCSHQGRVSSKTLQQQILQFLAHLLMRKWGHHAPPPDSSVS